MSALETQDCAVATGEEASHRARQDPACIAAEGYTVVRYTDGRYGYLAGGKMPRRDGKAVHVWEWTIWHVVSRNPVLRPGTNRSPKRKKKEVI